MKKDSQPKNGFTLIEVLISLVILSIITLITSSFLQSSIQSKELVFRQSSQTLMINLLGDSLREDVINAINIPLLDSRGEIQPQTFLSILNTNKFKFITQLKSGKKFSSAMVQVEYLMVDNKFLRRQFYAAAPAVRNEDNFSETVLLKNIKNINLEFSDGNSWHSVWPIDSKTNRKFPTLIKIDLNQENGETYSWIIHSNLKKIHD